MDINNGMRHREEIRIVRGLNYRTSRHEEMGHILAHIKLSNPRKPELRAIPVQAPADTGALMLCLPEQMAIAVTAFAVAGVANAFNIIDGYNGLSGVVAIICLLGLVYVADQVGDRLVRVGALSLVGAIAGFLVWNYPNGHIILGDGGAYCVGFLVAELSVLLVARNTQVPPSFPLMLSFYPIFETL